MDTQKNLDLLLSAIPDDPVRFRQLCEQVEDWDQVLNCALRHGVENFLYYHVIQIGFRLSPVIEERVRRWQLIRDLWQAHAQAALDEVLKTLHSINVRAVALKGPIFAARRCAYPRDLSSSELDRVA